VHIDMVDGRDDRGSRRGSSRGGGAGSWRLRGPGRPSRLANSPRGRPGCPTYTAVPGRQRTGFRNRSTYPVPRAALSVPLKAWRASVGAPGRVVAQAVLVTEDSPGPGPDRAGDGSPPRPRAVLSAVSSAGTRLERRANPGPPVLRSILERRSRNWEACLARCSADVRGWKHEKDSSPQGARLRPAVHATIRTAYTRPGRVRRLR